MTATPPVNAGQTLLAQTPSGGFALQNGTPNIISWTAPNDGKTHWIEVMAATVASVTMTGGATQVAYTIGGVATTQACVAGGIAAPGVGHQSPPVQVPVDPGTTVTISQSAAMTAGTANFYASIWGY